MVEQIVPRESEPWDRIWITIIISDRNDQITVKSLLYVTRKNILFLRNLTAFLYLTTIFVFFLVLSTRARAATVQWRVVKNVDMFVWPNLLKKVVLWFVVKYLPHVVNLTVVRNPLLLYVMSFMNFQEVNIDYLLHYWNFGKLLLILTE